MGSDPILMIGCKFHKIKTLKSKTHIKMNINKDTLKEFRTDLNDYLKELEKYYGVKCKIGTMTYTDSSFKFNTEVFVQKEGDNGKSATEIKAEQDFILWNFKWDNLEFRSPTKEDLGRTFRKDGILYTFVGSSHRSSKYPFIAKRPNGTFIKFPVSWFNVGMKWEDEG
jgi:hypothetical protein